MAINFAYLWLVAPKASDRLNSIGLRHNKLHKPIPEIAEHAYTYNQCSRIRIL
jgi:hypothetical protein